MVLDDELDAGSTTLLPASKQNLPQEECLVQLKVKFAKHLFGAQNFVASNLISKKVYLPSLYSQFYLYKNDNSD